MVGAVLAEGTAAGTDISNTATATYDDGNGNSFDATSNTVVIKVAEIAGLTAVASPVEDADGGAIEAGDDLTYTFTVTNVGNAVTDVSVPSLDGFRFENFVPSDTNPVQVFEVGGTTPIGTVQADGSILVSAVNPDASFEVRVTGNPESGTVAGESISVTLGDTDGNANPEGTDPTQNQPLDSNTPTGTAEDLFTVNVGPEAPQNGEREAQATGSGIFASSVRPLALATVLKTSSVSNVGNPSDPTDDLITYDLGLRVEDTSPSNLFQAAPLKGTNINLNGGTEERILVSDAIPAGTDLASVSTSLPTGWTAVYSTDDTAASPGNDPLAAAWSTTAPTDLSTVTRVGFVFNNTIGATGATLTGLQFTVVTNDAASVNNTIENIAQVFGQTVGDPAETDNDPNTVPQVIYDESGDDNPNNFNDDDTPPAPTGSEYVPGTDDGLPNRVDDGTDANNDNSGTGPDGEVNVVTLTPTTDDILNGTQDRPNAIGPTSDNDDFTNKSTPTPPAGTDPTAPFDPAPVTFNNSLSNPAQVGFIAETTIEPIAPSVADAQGVSGAYGNDADIPDGTVVTITANGQSATYTYNPASNPTGGFVLDSGAPVNVGDVVAGEEVDYTVEVNLPDGTAQLTSVAIPIIAFPDDDPTGTPGYTGETTNNITIDRLYTGFMTLVKEARVLLPDGSLKEDAAGTAIDFSATPLQAAPGEFIEYRIRYENISESAANAPGSVGLTANNFLLIEAGDGAVGSAANAPINNWANVTTHQQNTNASEGSVEYFNNNNSVAATDPVDGTVVDEYRNNVGSVAPAQNGEFTFRRVVD